MPSSQVDPWRLGTNWAPEGLLVPRARRPSPSRLPVARERHACTGTCRAYGPLKGVDEPRRLHARHGAGGDFVRTVHRTTHPACGCRSNAGLSSATMKGPAILLAAIDRVRMRIRVIRQWLPSRVDQCLSGPVPDKCRAGRSKRGAGGRYLFVHHPEA
jgi:hypothetical protein